MNTTAHVYTPFAPGPHRRIWRKQENVRARRAHGSVPWSTPPHMRYEHIADDPNKIDSIVLVPWHYG